MTSKAKPTITVSKTLKFLNTPLSEYSPVSSGRYLYFTSNRESKRIYLATGTPFTDIYRVRAKGAKVDMATLFPLDKKINREDSNEGSLAISDNGTYIIFAKGNTGKATGNNEVNLYFTRYRNKEWTNPRPLSVNDPDAWDSTPALASRGKTLYFSSTRLGGHGGADLYSATLNRRGRVDRREKPRASLQYPGRRAFPVRIRGRELVFCL